jgi:hypothetical protein
VAGTGTGGVRPDGARHRGAGGGRCRTGPSLVPCTPAKATEADEACATQSSSRQTGTAAVPAPADAGGACRPRSRTRASPPAKLEQLLFRAGDDSVRGDAGVAAIPVPRGSVGCRTRTTAGQRTVWTPIPRRRGSASSCGTRRRTPSLLAAAEKGDLDTSDAGVAKQVDRMVKSPRLASPASGRSSRTCSGFDGFAALAEGPARSIRSTAPQVATDAQEQTLRTRDRPAGHQRGRLPGHLHDAEDLI